jgi:hypothetical protein
MSRLVPDPNQAKPAARPAPRIDEVRRMLERYRRSTDLSRPRRARRRIAGPPVLKDR